MNREEIDDQSDSDRLKEVKVFDDTKAGVKGIVDAGVETLPKIFVRPPSELSNDLNSSSDSSLELPIIDLDGIEESSCPLRKQIVSQVLSASENWGFFQVINHGIPSNIMDEMIQAARLFHEQDVEAKKEFYTREVQRQVVLNTNVDLYKTKAANWRDTLAISTHYTGHLDPNQLPSICRDVIVDYSNHVTKLGNLLFELLSEALGLKSDHLSEMECTKGSVLLLHYYPACPQPELTLGVSKHSDPSILSVLLQDHISALQVLHQNQWVNVRPIPGALVINIGDMFQMISNNKLKSAEHRVIANHIGPRASVAMFFTGLVPSGRVYGPIKELLSQTCPPVYRDFTVLDYYTHFFSKPIDEPGFEHFKISS